MAVSLDRRSPEAEAWRRLYKTPRWQVIRRYQLTTHPLCAVCQQAGRITPATVCDHIDKDSKTTEDGFFGGPFPSLCDAYPWRCHSSRKQRIELLGYEPGCDVKGRPVDVGHPWNRGVS